MPYATTAIENAERWRIVPSTADRLRVSDLGRLLFCVENKKPRPLTPHRDRHGRAFAAIPQTGPKGFDIYAYKLVADLVLDAFEPLKGKSKHKATHKNRDLCDDRLDNLRRTPAGDDLPTGRASLTVAQVREIFAKQREGLRATEIASEYKINVSTVRRILNGETWPGIHAEETANATARRQRSPATARAPGGATVTG